MCVCVSADACVYVCVLKWENIFAKDYKKFLSPFRGIEFQMLFLVLAVIVAKGELTNQPTNTFVVRRLRGNVHDPELTGSACLF